MRALSLCTRGHRKVLLREASRADLRGAYFRHVVLAARQAAQYGFLPTALPFAREMPRRELAHKRPGTRRAQEHA